jgi:hypothetical protein
MMEPMPKKKKKLKPFSALKVVKELSRDRIGTLPASRVVPDRKKKLEASNKHKPKLEDLLNES